ncbi:Signal recognition particle subunit srp14 [Verticillium dahliae VDG2]|nr:Signal recognition particle subunit srp14 [Verticillium dahliae VDG2]
MACIAPPPARYRRALLVSLVVFIVLAIALGYTRLLSLDSLLPTDMHIPVLQKPRGRTGADRPMSYGETARPPFKDLPHPLATLDPALVPAADNNRRLIIIGDVHGMLAPLEALLKKLNHNAAPVSKGAESANYDDHLVFLGDMVNKGPDTPGVIDLLLRHNASAVRGNHEDRLSALVVAARGGGPVEHHVVQVDCEKPDKRREL